MALHQQPSKNSTPCLVFALQRAKPRDPGSGEAKGHKFTDPQHHGRRQRRRRHPQGHVRALGRGHARRGPRGERQRHEPRVRVDPLSGLARGLARGPRSRAAVAAGRGRRRAPGRRVRRRAAGVARRRDPQHDGARKELHGHGPAGPARRRPLRGDHPAAAGRHRHAERRRAAPRQAGHAARRLPAVFFRV